MILCRIFLLNIKNHQKNRHEFIYSPICFKFMLKVDGHVIREREKLEFSFSTTRFFTNFWIFIPERHTNLIFSKSRWRHKEKKKRKICRRQIFFFDLSCHQTLSKKIWRLRFFFQKISTWLFFYNFDASKCVFSEFRPAIV